MKELNVKIGQLYDFIKTYTKAKDEAGEQKLDIPFSLEVKDENDNWAKVPAFYKKEGRIVKVTFEGPEKPIEVKCDELHIFSIDPTTDKCVYAKDLKSGDELPGGFKVLSVESTDGIENVYSPQVDTDAHVYHDSNGILHHNTYEINQVVKNDWPSSPLKADGWTYTYNKGSLGSSASAIIAFFFEHRDKEIIVLDDADGFLAKPDPDIMNLLKGILNTENTILNPEPCLISNSAPLRKTAAQNLLSPEDALQITETENNYLHGMYRNKPPLKFMLKENENPTLIHIDQKRFNEDGYLDVEVNGNLVSSIKLSEEERKHYKVVSNDEYNRQREASLLGYGLSKKAIREGFDDFEDEESYPEEEIGGLPWNPYMGGGQSPSGVNSLPVYMLFTSRLIMISNLSFKEVDSAFRSRCDGVPVVLTHQEFIAHLGKVIKGLMKGLETSLDPALIEFMKMQAYGYLIKSVELEGLEINGQRVEINIPLQFRLVADIAGKWYATAQAYCNEYGLGRLTMENAEIVAAGIEAEFFFFTILPLLADNEYEGDSKKRRRK